MRYLPTDLCSTPGTTPGSASLLIDIHAHVFNGSDLQIADFIAHLGGYLDGVWSDVLREIGGLLQQVEWNRAPCGAKELEVLASVTCDAELGIGYAPSANNPIRQRWLHWITHRSSSPGFGIRCHAVTTSLLPLKILSRSLTKPHMRHMNGNAETARPGAHPGIPGFCTRRSSHFMISSYSTSSTAS